MSKRIGKPFLLVPVVLLATVVAAWAALPWPLAYRWLDPERTSLMRYRIREARSEGHTLEIRHEFVSLNDMSPALLRAVVLAEDARFREHRGIDWQALGEELHYDGKPPFSWTDPDDLRALVRAGRYYLAHRDEVRGRSTVTQQLAKNLYWTPERSLTRKVGELVVARRLEWLLDKDRILELYLNSVELGAGIFGVEAAARAYFGTSAARLTSFQAASLAATLPHPLTSNPDLHPGRMAWRRDLILGRMRGGRSDLPPIPDEPEEVTVPAPDLGDVEPEYVAPRDVDRADTIVVPTVDPGASPDTLLVDDTGRSLRGPEGSARARRRRATPFRDTGRSLRGTVLATM